MSTHANFTYQTRLYFFAVFIYNRNIIKGRGFTHGTRLRGGPRQIGQSQSCLGLPKTFVQFESGTKQDMATIAGVFYNRLNQDMRLESSVTVCYALYDQFDDPQDCETQTDVDSPYNTYLNNGLPVGPILNPGGDALLAVLEPESSEYLFFAADIHGDGKVYYSKTYEEHQRICEELGLILN